MQTGTLDIQGAIGSAGVYQLINETLITAADSYTKLLIRGDAIADATGKTVVAHGNAAVTTSQYKFASIGASIAYDGTTDWLTVADSPDWDWGSSNWTVETFVRTSVTANRYIIGRGEGYYSIGIFIAADGSVYAASYQPTSHTNNFLIYGTTVISDGNWHHVAAVRNGSAQYLFVDGVKQGTDGSFSGSIEADTLALNIGAASDGTYSLNGNMAEFRISVGIARYTSNFTPPALPFDGAITSLAITGLDGDTDEEYMLVCRFVAGAAPSQFLLRPNNDSGSNYGKQYLEASVSNAAAYRWTGAAFMEVGYAQASGNLSFSNTKLCSKSGYLRTVVSKVARTISGTTITEMILWSQDWNNTANNITSLNISSDQSNGIGVGTHILLFAKRG